MNAIATPAATPARYGAIDRRLRATLLGRMAALRGGAIEVTDALGRTLAGETLPGQPPVRVRVHGPGFYRAVAAQGSVGAGAAYIDGHWDCDDLVALVRLLVRNRDLLDAMEGGGAWLGGLLLRAWHRLRDNDHAGSRRNIAAHYDLGNDFFRLFLSPDLMYSSAIWAGEERAGDDGAPAGDTLEAASTRKLDRICRRLGLAPGMRVVEIGTGWGGFALHAARDYGCHVTTTTISREQHALAAQRVAEAGLQDRVTLLLDDYRDLRGTYDRLVSIEMVEAVGAAHLDAYFGQLSSLLAPDGLALVQAITLEDQRYPRALRHVDFIQRHVFPGSFIPSVAALLAANARNGDLSLVGLDDFAPSYARTLAEWRRRFMAALPEVRAQGFDDRFIRLWEFYLCYCEGGFREHSVGVSQLVFAKPGYAR